MLTTLIVIIHVIVCIALILIILLQTGKGADIGAVFGGGSSQTVFGSSGASSFLGRVTIVAAVTFMLTCIVLTYFSGRGFSVQQSIMKGAQAPAPPVEVPQGRPVEQPASPGAAERPGPLGDRQPAAPPAAAAPQPAAPGPAAPPAEAPPPAQAK